MAEKITPDSLFIWYHAEAGSETGFRAWLSELSEKTGIHGTLFVRHTEGKTTFMETYENIGCGALKTIEGLATEQVCFRSVQRRCEAFERLHSEKHPGR